MDPACLLAGLLIAALLVAAVHVLLPYTRTFKKLRTAPGEQAAPLRERPAKENPAVHNNNRNNGKSKKKQQHQHTNNHQNSNNSNNSHKNSKNGFQHQLLAASLMGHTDKILDMDCSPDGKYLVSCAEDELMTDVRNNFNGGFAKEDKENCNPAESPGDSSPGSPEGVRRNVRRRRRPRAAAGRFLQSPVPVAVEVVVSAATPPREPSPPPLKRFSDLNVNDHILASMLGYYLLPPDQMTALGYPMESNVDPTRAMIYTMEFPFDFRKFDNRFKEFAALHNRANSNNGEDSGRGSGSSSPRSGDSDQDSEEELAKYGFRRKCARCMRGFFVSANGEYLTRERCRHHWGRLQRGASPTVYSCCGQSTESLGCARAPLHVWSGISVGLNGPLEGFVRTKPPNIYKRKYKVLALDCEMCYTAAGLQVVQVEVVGGNGRRVYGSYILPDAPVIDYNTRFSGITAGDLKNATKTLREVQRDLMELIDSETILVGHGLENDLRALRILHERVVDTSICFPHNRGFPYRTSLRDLASRFLSMDVQQAKHCPLEDARASLDLMLYRLQQDFTHGLLVIDRLVL